MLYEIDKEDTSPSIFLCIFLSFRYLMNYFAQIYRAQYGAAILVYLQGTPTWRPENSVNIYFGYLGDNLSVLKKQAFT